MKITELIEQLNKKSSQEVELILEMLMVKGKISFTSLTKSYVKYLESTNKDKHRQLVEAECCVMESFFHNKGNKNEEDNKHTQRCLYLMNQSNRFQMNQLNEKYTYDEELGKKMSWYEREKKTL